MKTVLLTLAVLAGCRLGFEERLAPGDGPGSDAPGTPAMIELVQKNGSWGPVSGMAITVPFLTPLVAHDAILVGVEVGSLTVTLTAITDTLGNTYTQVLGPIDDGGVRSYLAVALDTAPGATSATAVFSGSTGNAGELFLAEYRGIALTDAVDGTQGSFGATFGLDAMQSGIVTTHGDRELLYGYGLGPCTHAGTGFAVRVDVHGDITEDVIVGAGPHQMTATGTCSASGDRWQMLAAALRPQLLP